MPIWAMTSTTTGWQTRGKQLARASQLKWTHPQELLLAVRLRTWDRARVVTGQQKSFAWGAPWTRTALGKLCWKMSWLTRNCSTSPLKIQWRFNSWSLTWSATGEEMGVGYNILLSFLQQVSSINNTRDQNRNLKTIRWNSSWNFDWWCNHNYNSWRHK